MAFVKRNYFAFEQNKEENPKEEKISIPLVFTRENGKIHGFVPGIVMKDVVCETKDECEKILKQHIKTFVIKTRKDGSDFPFFPSNEHIKRDFKNVILIKRVNIENK